MFFHILLQPLHSTSEDDGYETGGKKQASPRPKNVSNKEGRKVCCSE